MLTKEKYLEIKSKYGHYASWAIWADAGLKPKSNIGDLSIFDLERNPDIINYLNPNIVLCGLNISRGVENEFGNFHDSRPVSQDYKIRFALKGSILKGAYMTDIIKDLEQAISGNVMRFLKENENFEKYNVKIFENELVDLNSKDTLIIAFGNDSYNILKRNLKSKYQIIKIPHYSMQISKENYRNLVESQTCDLTISQI